MNPVPAWADVIVAIVAILALIVSLLSLRISSRAQRLAEIQDQRRQPHLAVSLLQGHFIRDGGGRIYSFELSVRNPSDSDNAVASIDLHLTYLVDSVAMTVKLGAGEGKRDRQVAAAELTVPVRIPAHDTAAGWCDFALGDNLLNGANIAGYRIVLTDSHEAEVSVEPIVVSERRDET